MALIKCEECGGQLSDRAVQCPACGAPQRKPVPLERRAIGAILGVVCFIVAGYYGSRVWEELGSSPVEQPKPAAAAPGDTSRSDAKTEETPEEHVRRSRLEELGLGDSKVVTSDCAT